MTDEETKQILREIREATREVRDAVVRAESERKQLVATEKRVVVFASMLVVIIFGALSYLLFRVWPVVDKVAGDAAPDQRVSAIRR